MSGFNHEAYREDNKERLEDILDKSRAIIERNPFLELAQRPDDGHDTIIFHGYRFSDTREITSHTLLEARLHRLVANEQSTLVRAGSVLTALAKKMGTKYDTLVANPTIAKREYAERRILPGDGIILKLATITGRSNPTVRGERLVIGTPYDAYNCGGVIVTRLPRPGLEGIDIERAETRLGHGVPAITDLPLPQDLERLRVNLAAYKD